MRSGFVGNYVVASDGSLVDVCHLTFREVYFW